MLIRPTETSKKITSKEHYLWIQWDVSVHLFFVFLIHAVCLFCMCTVPGRWAGTGTCWLWPRCRWGRAGWAECLPQLGTLRSRTSRRSAPSLLLRPETSPLSETHRCWVSGVHTTHCYKVELYTWDPADLLFCVVDVHDDVEDLENSTNDVDQDDCLIFLQKPIIQPAKVTMETRGALDVLSRAGRQCYWSEGSRIAQHTLT